MSAIPGLGKHSYAFGLNLCDLPYCLLFNDFPKSCIVQPVRKETLGLTPTKK